MLKKTILLILFLNASFHAHAASNKEDAQREVLSNVRKNAALLSESANPSSLAENIVTLDDALVFALQSNPDLRAKRAELPLAGAEREESGLVQGPQLEFATRFPVASSGAHVAYDLQLTQDVMALVQRGSKRRAGKFEESGKQWQVASELWEALGEVKVAYFRYQGARQLDAFWEKNLAAAEAAAELAQGQRRAGNLSELEASQNLALAKMAKLEAKKSRAEVLQARLTLAKWTMLPVAGSWSVPASLPKLPARDPDENVLRKWAESRRADLLAQGQTVAAKEEALRGAKRAVLPRLDVGVSAEWDADGSQGVGPVVALGLPFFGQRRAAINKAAEALEVEKDRLQARREGLPYDLGRIFQSLRIARQTLRFYQDEMLPLQRGLVQDSLKHYNYMLLGNYQLLQAKQNQIQAEREALQARLDYWVAYAELEMAAGASWKTIQAEEGKR